MAERARVHLLKLCVGADTIADLAAWQAAQGAPVCGTRAWPKRRDEVLAGGSLYWVIRGMVAVRQRIVAIAPVTDAHGPRCGLYLDAALIRTAPQPRRAFQGWRYLDPQDAPPDLAAIGGGGDLPEELRLKLVELGAW